MLATIPSATLLGIQGHPVTVEVHVSAGLPGFSIVGLPDAACREARDRVRAALLSSRKGWPQQRITVNLAPSSQRKGGSGLDLAIAVGLLVAAGNLAPEAVSGLAFLGELGLDGSVRAVPGTVPLVDALPGRVAVVPATSYEEARLVGRHEVRPVPCLGDLVGALAGDVPWPDPPPPSVPEPDPPSPDLADVRGNALGRRALEVAAAGGHHLLMVGPPGAGKSMLATRLPGLLPDLDRDTAMAATRVQSAAGDRLPAGGLVRRPPYRAPHHSATLVSLVGGGSGWLRPGEISRAHGGVLFLDELGEFSPAALDALRQPLEEGVVRVARAQASVEFPARFLLVAAMNPCPCGQGGPPGLCECTEPARARYARRLSGPLQDRFDLRIEIERADGPTLLRGADGEASEVVAARVRRARARAAARGVVANADLSASRLDQVATLDPSALDLLEREVRRGRLSGRGVHRIRRVARTLADLDEVESVTIGHVHEALALRVTPLGWQRLAMR